MSKQFINTIKSFDLFQKPVLLMIKKEEAHRTLFGALMTLFLLTVVLILLITSLMTLFNREQPKMISSNQFRPDPDRIELHPSNFTFQVGVQNANYATYIDDSIFKLTATLVTKYNTMVNGTVSAEWLNEDIPLTICSNKNAIRQTELQTFFSNLDQTTVFCVDWDKQEKLLLQGDFSSPNYTFILINIDTCTEKNRGPGDPPCQSQDIPKIQKLLLVPFGYNTYTTISPTTFKEITYYYQPTDVSTDFGLISSDIDYQKSMSFYQARELVDVTTSTNIAQIIFRLTTVESQNFRSYSKFQDILGQVGGLWNVLFLVAKYLQYPLSVLSYKLAIINSLFNFDGQDDDINEETTIKRQQTLKILNVPSEQLFTNREEQQIKPIRKNKKKLSTIKKKLQNIKIQNDQLENMQDGGSQKNKYATQLNESIKHFFDTVSKKLRLGCLEFTTQFKIGSTKTKQIQYDYSVQKMEKSLDVLYIIKKIQEIDKLKVLLLNQHQIKVFDYLPKPLITEDPMNSNSQPYFSILSPSKSNFQKAIEAQLAFREIMNNLKDPINQQLIKCMDAEILELLKMQLTNEKSFTSSQQFIDEKKPMLTNVEVNIIECNDFVSQPIEEDQEERILQVRSV
ncbi:hypothetical protein pb186bvf_007163 [Paramecium bursaria]